MKDSLFKLTPPAVAVLSTDGFPRRRGPVTGNNRLPLSSPLLSPAPYGSDFKFEIALLLLDLRPTERRELSPLFVPPRRRRRRRWEDVFNQPERGRE